MKKLNVIVWLVLSICIQAQDEWMNLIAPEKINKLKEIDGKYYCATDGGLLIFDEQTKSLERVTLKDGLPSPRIEDIAVDNNGNIWIGTYDNGVAMRLDNGWNHIPTPVNGWTQNTGLLYCLEFDQFNNLWIGTQEGLFKYVDEEWESVSLNNIFGSSVVWDMQRDDEGNIYMASHWPFKLEGTEIIEYPSYSAFAYGKACIDYDDTGKIYFGMDGGVFAIIEGDEWTIYDNEDFLNSPFMDVEVMSNGDVWVSLIDERVYKLSEGIWTNILQTGTYDTYINFCETNDGDIIIGLKDKLYKANDEYIELEKELVDLTIPQFSNNYLDITVNENQQILVMSDNSLLKFNDQDLKTVEIDPPADMEDFEKLITVRLKNNTIGFFEPETGKLYYNNRTISIFDPLKLLGTSYYGVSDFFVDSEGSYWIATSEGLVYKNRRAIIVFKEDNSPFQVTNNNAGVPIFYLVAEDRYKNIWVSSHKGVGQWNRITKTWVYHEDDTNLLSGNLSANLHFDENNVLWASGWGTGLIRFDGSNWSIFYNYNSNIPSDFVEDIYPWENMLILATREGLVFFDGDDFKTYTTENSGLGSNYCKTIEQDANGNIWIAHEKYGIQDYGGISIFNPKGIIFSKNNFPQLGTPIATSLILNEDHFFGTSVYPNPANKFINIDFTVFDKNIDEVQLMDTYGKIYFSKNISPDEAYLKILTDDLVDGIYILKVNNGEQIKSRKIIIQ